MHPDATLAQALARDGVRTLRLAGVEQALQAGRLACFDAVVLDATLAGAGVGTVLAELRGVLHCPVLLVAGPEADEIDEIVALELGADTFLVRPLAPRRLRAHLAALLRRQPQLAPTSEPAAAQPRYSGAGAWVLDTMTSRLLRGTRQVPLTELQSRLLLCFMQRPGRMVPRAELVAALPQGHNLQARSVDVYIHRLRQRLREQAVEGLAVEVVRGRGYVLEVGQPEVAAA